jgi:phosphatidylglycerophosphatase C
MDLALFDFDGTITVKDTFLPFMHLAVPRARVRLGTALLSPMILAYRLGAVRASTMRAAIVFSGLSGASASKVNALGARYAAGFAELLRPEAQERLTWHQQRGDQVVVVSASLDVYLSVWCAQMGVDLICTQLESRGGVLTGRSVGGDCSGAEKAKRVRARYPLGSYQKIYAYGDTAEDRELLALAHEAYLCWRRVSP